MQISILTKTSENRWYGDIVRWLVLLLCSFLVVFHAGDVLSETDTGLWEVYQEVQQLKKELRQLRGVVEEQEHRLNQLDKQQKGHYLDFDDRLNSLAEKVTLAKSKGSDDQKSGAVSQGEEPFKKEKARYLAAKAFVEERKLEEATAAFKQLIADYPEGKFTAYAHYWLGEVYMAFNEPQLDEAKVHFEIVIDQHPKHPKTGATLYKLGKLYHLQKEVSKAREVLNRAIQLDPDGRVAKLAQKYLAQMK